MKKGMIFIDGSNLYYDYKKYTGEKVNIKNYINLIKEKFKQLDIIRAYYFTTETENNKIFLQEINKLPYCQVVRGHLQNKVIAINETNNLKCKNCGESVVGEITIKTDKGTDVSPRAGAASG